MRTSSQGRRFDPDWSLGLAIFAVVYFAAVGVGAWFFWTWLTG